MQSATESKPKVNHVLLHALMLSLAMNVIRMIKLFGWEPRVASQLSKKRDEELQLVKRNKVLNLVNTLMKYISLFLRISDTYSRLTLSATASL